MQQSANLNVPKSQNRIGTLFWIPSREYLFISLSDGPQSQKVDLCGLYCSHVGLNCQICEPFQNETMPRDIVALSERIWQTGSHFIAANIV
jgi:hypothetical protein